MYLFALSQLKKPGFQGRIRENTSPQRSRSYDRKFRPYAAKMALA